MSRRLAWFLCIAGCSGSPPLPDPMPLCSAALPKTAVAVPDEAAIKAAGRFNGSVCTEKPLTGPMSDATGSDIAPAGYKPIGAAVKFDGQGGPFPHGIDFVIPADLSKVSGALPRSIVVVEKRPNGAVLITPIANVVYEEPHKRLHFHGDE